MKISTFFNYIIKWSRLTKAEKVGSSFKGQTLGAEKMRLEAPMWHGAV